MSSSAHVVSNWKDARWADTIRLYDERDVDSLRGSIKVDHTIARLGAQKLWRMLHEDGYVSALGAMTGNQAVQMVQAGLRAIYLSGWQVAADANLAGQTYPDMSLYPSNSVPMLVRRLNQALIRADQIEHLNSKTHTDWLCPIVADGEAGFGGALNVFELMKAMIEAGTSGVHFEDQLASEKKCGHMGGKVLVPTAQFIRTLNAARLASDVLDVPTIIVARTDARDANLLTSDADPRDARYLTGERTTEGYFRIRNGLELATERGLAYAPYADLLWFETQEPNLEEARSFARAIHERYPTKLLAYNLSPSFNWDKFLSKDEQAEFQSSLADLGYRFQFVTLAGFHALNQSTFELSRGFSQQGLPAYVRLQRREFEIEREGYTATRHQAFVGAGYFDEVSRVLSGGETATASMEHSTEVEQFQREIEAEPKQIQQHRPRNPT